ncbi:unnamed protein product [Cuscuta campestris]|uniref:DUF7950 domain-containing protein n=1 Tax=Cuscuta campestris TaxID=132261 RepID=A0A484NFL3_9ASTE|nr:unnamed protein product [Cuscuta campestris]
MARYRPIAPKPAEASSSACPNSSNNNDAGLPPSISRSPFLRDVWAQLQARPTRTRKRGRSAALAPPHLPLIKRPRPPCFQGISPPPFRLISFNNGGFPALPKLVSLKCGFDRPVSTMSSSISVPSLPREEERGGIDLNRAAVDDEDFSCPVRPRLVRPVGSCIYVGSITPAAAEEKDKEGEVEKQGRKGKRKRLQGEEVEEEVETEVLPAVVSDSKNKVRLANSAYKEMVGQPECCWLDYTSPGGGKGTGRIGGEVVLHFLDSGVFPTSSERFTCWVRIEWRCNEKKNSVRAFCDAVKLGCQSRDYLFEWRFHPTETSSSSSEFQV